MEFAKTTCVAKVENLAIVTEFVEECADRIGLDAKKRFGLLIAVEEAFINICSYAYPDGEGDATFLLGQENAALVLEIADSGAPFDILSIPDPDTTLDIMDREVGGLGGYFIRKFTDEVSYRRENGHNILRMVLRRTQGDLP